jgi:hypothetical protein
MTDTNQFVMQDANTFDMVDANTFNLLDIPAPDGAAAGPRQVSGSDAKKNIKVFRSKKSVSGSRSNSI